MRVHVAYVAPGTQLLVDIDLPAGATVDVVDAAGAFLARAAYSPLSQIRARAWSFDSTQALDASFFANAIARACAARQPLLDAAHTACRLVHGESDQLPGVIADRYGDTIVVQLLSAGADTWREAIADALVAATGARCVYERSDVEVRLLEDNFLSGALAAGLFAGLLRPADDRAFSEGVESID